MKTPLLITLVLFTMLLGTIAAPTAYSATTTTTTSNSSEPLLKKVFLFGSLSNLTTTGNTTTVQAASLFIVFRNPFQVYHFTAGQPLTFLSQQHGILLNGKFLIGGFTVLLPINQNSIAVLTTTTGTMLIELYEDKTPNTTANFIALANDLFYDGLVFHRVIDDFVIQVGGYYPNGTEKISPYGTIDLELHPEAKHCNGALGMARTSDPNSATSQFYICDGRQPYLDGEYAVFGRIIDGIDIVRQIAAVETTTKYGLEDWPVEDVVITSITIVSP